MSLTQTLGILPSNTEPLLDSKIQEDENLKSKTTYTSLDNDSMNSLISLELCLNLMHINKESLGRVLVITSATDPPKLRIHVGRVFVHLLKKISDKHLKPAFSTAIDRLKKSPPPKGLIGIV